MRGLDEYRIQQYTGNLIIFRDYKFVEILPGDLLAERVYGREYSREDLIGQFEAHFQLQPEATGAEIRKG